ncbi:hypothetical protein, partial [Lacticaseibacillus sp. N501-2]|uniref:hypothetical protein n=1 Tax=Lacticaseibacillus salsurae TaxID=3367729 RepID=UPI0038B3E044
LKTLSDATFEILGQFFRRVVSILAPNGVKKIAELGNSLRRLQRLGLAWGGQVTCHFEIDLDDMEDEIPISVYKTTK